MKFENTEKIDIKNYVRAYWAIVASATIALCMASGDKMFVKSEIDKLIEKYPSCMQKIQHMSPVEMDSAYHISSTDAQQMIMSEWVGEIWVDELQKKIDETRILDHHCDMHKIQQEKNLRKKRIRSAILWIIIWPSDVHASHKTRSKLKENKNWIQAKIQEQQLIQSLSDSLELRKKKSNLSPYGR